MRHQVAGRRLNRTSEHLRALLTNLVTALFTHEQIRTTLPKAKEARRVAERLITLAKDSALHRRRHAARTIRDPQALAKLFGVLGPRFLNRPGGYTRIVKLNPRVGDNAPMALLELVERTPRVAATPETKDQKAGLEKSAPEEQAGSKGAKKKKAAEPSGEETQPKAAKQAKAKGEKAAAKASGKAPASKKKSKKDDE
jgi:large subunit ribosomal protein L17